MQPYSVWIEVSHFFWTEDKLSKSKLTKTSSFLFFYLCGVGK